MIDAAYLSTQSARAALCDRVEGLSGEEFRELLELARRGIAIENASDAEEIKDEVQEAKQNAADVRAGMERWLCCGQSENSDPCPRCDSEVTLCDSVDVLCDLILRLSSQAPAAEEKLKAHCHTDVKPCHACEITDRMEAAEAALAEAKAELAYEAEAGEQHCLDAIHWRNKADSATAALLALGCRNNGGVWEKFHFAHELRGLERDPSVMGKNADGFSGLWKPITPSAAQATGKAEQEEGK